MMKTGIVVLLGMAGLVSAGAFGLTLQQPSFEDPVTADLNTNLAAYGWTENYGQAAHDSFQQAAKGGVSGRPVPLDGDQFAQMKGYWTPAARYGIHQNSSDPLKGGTYKISIDAASYGTAADAALIDVTLLAGPLTTSGNDITNGISTQRITIPGSEKGQFRTYKVVFEVPDDHPGIGTVNAGIHFSLQTANQGCLIGIDNVGGLSGAVVISPEDGQVGVASPVNLQWMYAENGVLEVDEFYVYLDTSEALVAEPNLPTQPMLIDGDSAAATAHPTDPNLVIGSMSYGPIALDTTYYWRVDTKVYEPNYEAGQPDPNIPVFNIPKFKEGGVWSFKGTLTTVEITGQPADAYILPGDDSHLFDAAETAQFSVTYLATLSPKTAVWYKNAVQVAQWNLGVVTADPGYNVVVDEVAKTARLEISVSGMDVNPSVGEAFEGDYTCTVTVTNDNSDTSGAAKLYVSSEIMTNRWSFTTGSDQLKDSVTGIYAVVVDPITPGNIAFANNEVDFDPSFDANTSGDPNAHYVDLNQANLVSKLGKYATIMIWFNRDNNSPNYKKLLDCHNGQTGDLGSRLAADATVQVKFNTDVPGAGNDYVNQAGDVSNNALHVLTAVVNDVANTQTVYMDGALVNSGPTNDLSQIDDLYAWLGRSHAAADPLYDGSIDEIRFYNIAMTAPWIEAYADAGPDNLAVNPCLQENVYDRNDDCVVDLADFAEFARYWMTSGLFNDLY